MITIEQAKQLKHGDYLLDTSTNKRWKVTSKIKLWKRDPGRFEFSVKHGLYDYGIVTDYNNETLEVM